jgi:S-adenosylmethionine/arginine decarboxylase-like enzyme
MIPGGTACTQKNPLSLFRQIKRPIENAKKLEQNMHIYQQAQHTVPPTDGPVFNAAIEKNIWGIAASIDIYDCNPEKIRSADTIRRFVVELCELIAMKRFGETQVVHFGEDERVAGYSMVQLIETSLISAHFANMSNTTYLDVFSCKTYDPEVVRGFSQRYFGGSRSNLAVTIRH